ncbi:MAG: succinate dehydrogenase, hydrophobic membrane anchor protein [Methylobacter sp.]|nr:succinate dehydrogenase, hydrophobic membrane anchor protein [Methylobacter sp.]MDP2098538.1 succinate dehydrogenase, hydrophobic membrane anchor protein [Methylobacter sp.]MDP2428231.1 succinate dehydrogenase, hydrophobic membrane anchor protein [Methylobacter sp.]MDP3053744.1 succinate dehydrogenase, hydrophobic membrane anchor protein [Methylobacter sp.]MDP3363965.1 succinate dehydrogenase, hydrophobic membrane anchor protein [Methylobacter sp.]
MDYRTPLSRVRGLGSAKSGTGHWWMQRVTAVALIPLSFWLIYFLGLSITAPYSETLAWLMSPLNSVGIVAWIIAAFYHAALGLQVVIEDYVAAEGSKIILIWAVNLAFLLLAIAALLAVFRVVSIG